MVPSRNGPKGAEIASFGLAILLYVLTPTQIGDQGIAGSAQPVVRWREHLIASPFGTIHAATFRMPRPIGTQIPEPPRIRLASLGMSDIVGSIGVSPSARREDAIEFPTINRAGKGDRLVPGAQPDPAVNDEPAAHSREESPEQTIMPARVKTGEIELNDHSADEMPDAQAVVLAEIAREAQRRNAPVKPDEIAAAMHVEPFPEYDISLSLEMNPRIVTEDPIDLSDLDPTEFTPNAPPSLEGLNAEVKETRLYFGNELFGNSLGDIKPWAIGEEPVLMGPRVRADPDMKQTAALPAAAVPGVTVAGKGEVTGDDRRPKSPAERLSLSGVKRAKAEKCLANAVYFESRSEPVRGQIAVAQVVMNRVFSGYYPSDVCGVVYQNAHRHLACQFTFACDGIPDIVTDQESWARAQRIARETLDGKLWLPEIAKSTHYHASYVHPYWVRAMRKNSKIGLHNFYRPRKWGDGSDEPSWGSATYTADAAAKM
jgi:spore germination cell wall hydrolase CwlJ-like protein